MKTKSKPKREETETDETNQRNRWKNRKKKLTLSRWRKGGWNSRDDEDPGATT